MVKGKRLGATLLGDGRCRFRVWAPRVEEVAVHLEDTATSPMPLRRDEVGYFETVLEGIAPGTRYRYALSDPVHGLRLRPDPVSRLLPEGLEGATQVVEPAFPWSDSAWRGLPLEESVFYEVHVGTFTPEGTFEAIIPRLERLLDLGVTALELMPVAQFPGTRNWGYDGASLYAVQNSYGGPAELRRLVDACHGLGLAVVLDVVYNHFGPQGNYLAEFGPYFTDAYKTPWGGAVNLDGAGSDEVRRFLVGNALEWFDEYHVDALRLDALHALIDRSAVPFLRDLAEAVRDLSRESGRRLHLIAESDQNDRRLLLPFEREGFGLDAQWNDDFHHALHVLLTGERRGYYQDFGGVERFARAWRDGFVYTGQHSLFRGRRHGSPSSDIPARRFVVCAQNHDQIGNRMLGERLASLVSFEALRTAACAVLLSPFLPLLFMGEEYGETAPFLYFTSHTDPNLAAAVREGRRAEFASFIEEKEAPDPQAEETFARSCLRSSLEEGTPNRGLRDLHAFCLRLRREIPALALPDKEKMEVRADEPSHMLVVRRWSAAEDVVLLLDFGAGKELLRPRLGGGWTRLLDTGEFRWGGGGPTFPETLEENGALGSGGGRPRAALYRRPRA